MCWDCAKFVRGCTCTVCTEYCGGASENVRAQISRNFSLNFAFFSETKLYGQKMSQHWEIKGRFRKRVVLANVPSFRFSFRGNMRTYPCSSFRSGGTSEGTLVRVFVPGEHPPKPPFWKTTLSWWTFRIFFFSACKGKGKAEAPAGGGGVFSFFIENARREGGSPRKGGGRGGRECVCRELGGGGGQNVFFFGAEMPAKLLSTPDWRAQSTSENHRFSQKTADFRRLGSVTLGPSP